MAAFVPPPLLCSVFSLPLSDALGLCPFHSLLVGLRLCLALPQGLCGAHFCGQKARLFFFLKEALEAGLEPHFPLPLVCPSLLPSHPRTWTACEASPTPKGRVVCAALGPHTWLRPHTQRARGNKGQPAG